MTDPANTPESPLRRTPLYDLHVELGARMVSFAGWEMPVQYPAGVLREHLHTRSACGLFDVSHMGQAVLSGDDPRAAFESLVPGDLQALSPGRLRYTLLLDETGGIIDDLIVTRPLDDQASARDLLLIVNAAGAAEDFAHIAAVLQGRASLCPRPELALLALQGPAAARVMARLAPDAGRLAFMSAAPIKIGGIDTWTSRSGYTGEDGFEISVAGSEAVALARCFLQEREVMPVGLGARDSLRLEAGLCLYGNDIDRTTSPVEADLVFAIAKRRRASGDFPGAGRILRELTQGSLRRRVGFRPEGRQPARAGTPIKDMNGAGIGMITSGTFGPSAEAPVAMGYVDAAASALGTVVGLDLRGRIVTAAIAPMPFVSHRYHRA